VFSFALVVTILNCRSGEALRYVKNQTPELCLEALRQDGYSIRYVKNQTPELCLEAVKKNGRALRYVNTQTEEMCMIAVRQESYTLIDVKNQTDEICLEAVRKNHDVIQYIRDLNQRNRLFPALHTEDEEAECPVCYMKCNTKTKCHHPLCEECCRKLITRICPYCRSSM
jgi:hypothetical protein